jgi:histidinol-phosphate aminotransferase
MADIKPEPLSRRTWLRYAASLLAAPGIASGSSPKTLSERGTGPARLSLNENPFGCSPLAVHAVTTGLADLNRYTEKEASTFTGHLATREGCSAQQLLVGDILQLLGTRLSLAGGPGGEFIYSTPGFTELVDAAEAAGGVGVAVPLNRALENDLEAIAARVNGRTRAIFLVNPHNPSGTVSDANALESFVREVSKRTLVIVDEAYLEFMEDFQGRTLARRVLAGDNVVVFRTFSKIYGLAGLPLGYALLPIPLAQTLRRAGAGDPHEINRLALRAASAALEDNHFVRMTRDQIALERAQWHALLDSLGVKRAEARANFVFFETRRPHDEIAAAFLRGGIDIGRAFAPLTQWARISIGLPHENSAAQAAVASILGTGSGKGGVSKIE